MCDPNQISQIYGLFLKNMCFSFSELYKWTLHSHHSSFLNSLEETFASHQHWLPQDSEVLPVSQEAIADGKVVVPLWSSHFIGECAGMPYLFSIYRSAISIERRAFKIKKESTENKDRWTGVATPRWVWSLLFLTMLPGSLSESQRVLWSSDCHEKRA